METATPATTIGMSADPVAEVTRLLGEARAWCERLRGGTGERLTRAGREQILRSIGELTGVLAVARGVVLREVEAVGHLEGRDRDLGGFVARTSKEGPAAGRGVARAAAGFGLVPELERELLVGAVPPANAHTLAQAIGGATDAHKAALAEGDLGELMRRARRESAPAYAKTVRRWLADRDPVAHASRAEVAYRGRGLVVSHQTDGSLKFAGRLDPVAGQAFEVALDAAHPTKLAAGDERTHAQRSADALVAIVNGFLASQHAKPSALARPLVIMHMDAAAYRAAKAAHARAGGAGRAGRSPRRGSRPAGTSAELVSVSGVAATSVLDADHAPGGTASGWVAHQSDVFESDRSGRSDPTRLPHASAPGVRRRRRGERRPGDGRPGGERSRDERSSDEQSRGEGSGGERSGGEGSGGERSGEGRACEDWAREGPQHDGAQLDRRSGQGRGSDRRVAAGSPAPAARRGLSGLISSGMLDNGEPLSGEELVWLSCDCQVMRLVVGADGVPVDVGRTQRTWTNELRHAVHARDGGCAWPGCGYPARWTEVHHRHSWATGGSTSVENGISLCRTHHRQTHLAHVRIDKIDGRFEFYDRTDRPIGTTHHRTAP